MRPDYKAWLEAQQYGAGTITAQLHRTGRVEECYGDLSIHFLKDQFASIISELTYSVDDQRRDRPNPSRIPFSGDIRTNLASYKNALALYGRFLGVPADDITAAVAPKLGIEPAEDVAGQRIGLERDLQSTLRKSLDQLEPGLVAIDEGAERSVQSGFIDITAKNAKGAVVVIELKAGTAGQRAVAQILSYMGDIAIEEPEATLRGILIAADFDAKAKAAARMVPTLSLQKYSVKFSFAVSE
ncbi:MAG: endonuclease NucS domain-containing protein [Brevundimonas sp.]